MDSTRGALRRTDGSPPHRSFLLGALGGAACAAALACGGGGGTDPTPPFNRPPSAPAGTALTMQEAGIAVTLAATDADGDALTFAIATPPAHGTLSGTPPSVSYLPAAGYSGADAFTFTASDAEATSAPATVTVTVYPAAGPLVPGGLAIDLRMAALLRAHAMPGGASLAISKDGKLVLARGYGWADPATRSPFLPGSLGRIASISNPVTMAAILHLVEAGALGLDDRLVDRLPSSVVPTLADPRARDMTLRQVLGHAAGFPSTTDYNPLQLQATVMADLGLTAPPTCGEVLRWWLGHRSLSFAPGTSHAFASLGFCALGLVVEQAAGTAYQDWVRAEVLAPMGIHAMRFAGSHLDDRAPGEVVYASPETAPSVFPGDPPTVPRAYGSFSVPAYGGGGAWIASTVDLVRLLDGLEGRGRAPFLAPASYAMALADQWPGFGYGLGIDYYVGNASGTLWKGHAGWFGASPRTLAFRSDDGWAFALLVNSEAVPTYSHLDAFRDVEPIVSEAIAGGFSGATDDLYPSFPSPDLGPYPGN